MKIFDWVQVITGLAVVIGLVLVVYELRQTRDMVHHDMVNAGIAMRSEQMTSFTGENPAAAWVKGCLDPEKMTPEDVAVLYETISTLHLDAERVLMMEELGFNEFDNVAFARSYMERFLGFRLGMAEYQLYPENFRDDIRQIVEQILAEGTVQDCKSWFEPLFERVTLFKES